MLHATASVLTTARPCVCSRAGSSPSPSSATSRKPTSPPPCAYSGARRPSCSRSSRRAVRTSAAATRPSRFASLPSALEVRGGDRLHDVVELEPDPLAQERHVIALGGREHPNVRLLAHERVRAEPP